MASSIHAEKLFHCPVSLLPNGDSEKAKRFSTLSGLAQHVESEACQGGGATLKMAVSMIEDRLRTMGFGDVKLLNQG